MAPLQSCNKPRVCRIPGLPAPTTTSSLALGAAGNPGYHKVALSGLTQTVHFGQRVCPLSVFRCETWYRFRSIVYYAGVRAVIISPLEYSLYIEDDIGNSSLQWDQDSRQPLSNSRGPQLITGAGSSAVQADEV